WQTLTPGCDPRYKGGPGHESANIGAPPGTRSEGAPGAMRKNRLLGLTVAAALVAGGSLLAAPAAYADVPAPVLHYTFDALGPDGAAVPAGSMVPDAAGTHPGTV